LLRSSPGIEQDPIILSGLETLHVTLPAQLDAVTGLAAAGDWPAVRLRLAEQVPSLIDLSSSLVERIDREVLQVRAEAIESTQRARRQLFLVVPITALLTLLIAVALGWYTTRAIIDPLSELDAGAQALARGEFEHEVDVRGEDELARLGSAFNYAARRIRGLYESVLRSEKQLRDVIETIPAMAWTALPDGSNAFTNRQWVEYTGLSVAGTVGSGWQAVIHPKDIDQYVERWRSSLTTGRPFENEIRLRRAADGKYRWFLVRAVPLRDERGNILKWYGIATDIEDRKRAEGALRRSEAYLTEAQRLTHTGSWARDPATGKTTYWSEEMFRIYGFDPQRSSVPTREEYYRLLHPEDYDRVLELVQKAFREKADFTKEFRVVLPDGAVKHLHVIGHPVLDQTGEVVEYVGTAVDVTERKRAEEQHREYLKFLESLDRVNRTMQGTNDREKMMSDVLDSVLEIFACDRAWLVYPCDPEGASWRAIMEHTRAEFPGAFALGTDLPVDAEVTTVFRAARATSGAVLFGPDYELQIPAEVAERFSIRSMMVMTLYPKGDQPYLFGLHQCSHPRLWTPQEQRLFEEIGHRLADALTSLLMFRGLRESERRLAEAQSIAHVGYWDRDSDAGRVTLSGESCRIFGFEPEERVFDLQQFDEKWDTLIHLEDALRIDEAAAAALRGDLRYDVEFRVVRRDGDVRVVHSRGEVTRDEFGRPQRMFGTIQDITELRQAESALRESEQRYRMLFEKANDAIFLENESDEIIEVNRRACELLGYSREELLMMKVSDLLAPEFRSQAGSVVRDELEKHGSATYEAVNLHRSGRHIAVEVTNTPISDQGQNLLLSIVRDITEHKRAEEERERVRRLQFELAHIDRINMLGELAASLAHELNQPIAAAITSAGACLRWLNRDQPEVQRAREAVMRIESDGKRASEIINRLRAFYKKEAPPERHLVALNEVAREILGLLSNESNRYAISIRDELAPDLPPIKADRVQLQQVLMNLMLNAVEAMKEAPGELTIKSEPGDGHILVSVSDTGVGLPPGKADELFNAFFTTKPDGTGMGLAISRSIVESHGGRLWAAANPGRGATFHFTLPTQPEAHQ
jgi:PAS domain S-box-containing protein